MKRILFVIPSMRIGGAEKSLTNLLNLIDLNEYDINLLMFKPGGDFLQQIPSGIHILKTDPSLFYAYKCDKNVFSCKAGIRSEIQVFVKFYMAIVQDRKDGLNFIRPYYRSSIVSMMLL